MRRPQFSLKSMLWLMAVVAIASAIYKASGDWLAVAAGTASPLVLVAVLLAIAWSVTRP